MSKFNGIYKEDLPQFEVINSHVTLEEVKRNLQFDDPEAAHDDDDQIKMLIEAAREAAENYTGRILAYTEILQHIYNFSGQTLKININPYIDIKEIKVSQNNGETFTTLATTDYYINKRNSYFEIWFENSKQYDEIKIYFHAGYKENDLPARIRQYIILEASDGYDTDRSKYSYQVVLTDAQKRILGPFIINRY